MPTRHGMNLIDRDPETITRLVFHPLQLRVCKIIEESITQLRKLKTPPDYYDFQYYLFQHVKEAQELQAAASRHLKRQRAHRPVPAAPSGDWELELLAMNRIVLQLRSVGDALAWHAFGFDRRFIIALSRNDPVSPFVSQKGLEAEIAEVVATWQQDRTFALLHDLTNCLRIADLTKFTDGGPRLLEKKTQGPGKISSAQMRRIRHAVDVINTGAPLESEAGPLELFVAKQPFKTHLGRLSDGLTLAERDGMSSIRLGLGWVVSTFTARQVSVGSDLAAAITRWDTLKAQAFRKAGMDESQHHLVGRRLDDVGTDPTLAPFGIYPFSPAACARLTCDQIVFQPAMTWDRLARAFEDVGFLTHCPLPEAHQPNPSTTAPVLIATKGETRITLHGYAINQILFELIDPNVFVAGTLETIDGRVSGTISRGALTFSNEKAVWK